MTTADESIGALKAQVAALTVASHEQAELLRQHMLREEAMTRELLGRLAALDRRIGAWQGMAAGAGLVVSAVWALILAALAWFKN
jgi:hypothetical protein